MTDRRQGAQQMQDQLDTLSARVTTIESTQRDHMEQTARTESNTRELIETFSALKGAWAVLDFVGKLAKPVAIIAATCGIVWASIKLGFQGALK